MNKKIDISKELQTLVSWSVSVLGDAIRAEYGSNTFLKVENLRKKMKTLRSKKPEFVYQELSKELSHLKKYSDIQIHQICHSFSLMLELINRCETSYRAYKLENKKFNIPKNKTDRIIFVLTAHPTEARSPELLGLFENIQEILINTLKEENQNLENELYHLLLISLKVSLAREAKPTVADEAKNIYSYILKDEILDTLVKFSKEDVSVSMRSWVGGDKDGHPGVNEITLVESLTLSRARFINYIQDRLNKVSKLVGYIDDEKVVSVSKEIKSLIEQLNSLKKIKHLDGQRIKTYRNDFQNLIKSYEKIVKVKSPELDNINRLNYIFPALVVPLEIREDSEVVKESLLSEKDFAITKMLKRLKEISEGYFAKWYVRGFVLSMVESANDVQNGFALTKKVFGNYEIPVVPLFENEKALTNAEEILTTLLSKNKTISKTHKNRWNCKYEVMVGYSDSSKENGVFPSRLMISSALRNIEKTLTKFELIPVFFHGSGGSIERGGGSLKEQTGWWPKSAIQMYKATIQGEMVARNFGSEHVLSKQIHTILDQLGTFKKKKTSSRVLLKKFSRFIREEYSSTIKNDDFLSAIELATPYSFLHHLKIGSRPSKRAGGSIKNNLRAIPWILCWTQTRILFPTWWGVGKSWSQLTTQEKSEMKKILQTDPILSTYVKALGFTLAKIELGVWKLYLENSKLETKLKSKIYKQFVSELELTKKFFSEITGNKDNLWFRPWLQQSIDFRSSMIHPLNLCQLESLRREDHELLRSSVTGIACGMLTTG